MKPHLQLEIEHHGPQWQRKVRVSVNDGQGSVMRGHGTMFLSDAALGLLARLLLTRTAADITLIWTDDIDGQNRR